MGQDVAEAIRKKKEADPEWAFKDIHHDPTRFRVWDTTAYIRPYKVLDREAKLPILYTGKPLLLQPLKEPETTLEFDDKIIFGRRFFPSTVELGSSTRHTCDASPIFCLVPCVSSPCLPSFEVENGDAAAYVCFVRPSHIPFSPPSLPLHSLFLEPTHHQGPLEEFLVDRREGVPSLSRVVARTSGIEESNIVFAKATVFPYKSDPLDLRDTS